MHDETATVGVADANVAGEADRLLEGGVRAAIELVLTGDTRRVLRGIGLGNDDGRRRRIVVVEELGEEGTEAQLTARARVVRDEDAELLLGNQREVGMEPSRVAAVADDAEAVAGFLVEAQREARNAWIVAEGPRVHPLRRRVGEN